MARERPKRRLHQAQGSDDNAGRRKAPRLVLVHGEEGAPPRYNFPVIDPTADDGAALVPGVHTSPGLVGQYGQRYDSGGGSPGFVAKNGEDERSRGQGMDLDLDREFSKNGEDERSRGQGMDLDLDREFSKNGEDELSRGQGLDLDLNREFAKNGKELIPNAGKEEGADAAVSRVHTSASASDVDKKRTNAELLWELKCDLFEEYDVMLVLLERISVLTEDLRYCSDKVTAAKKDEIAAAWKSIRDHRTVCTEIIKKTRQAKGYHLPDSGDVSGVNCEACRCNTRQYR